MPFDKKALIDKAAKEVMGAGDAALRKRLEAKQGKATAAHDEPDGDESCPKCGYNGTEEMDTCPQCGAELPPDDEKADGASECEMSDADLGELAAARSKMLGE